MEVHFTPEQEAQLSQIARNNGTDTEHQVQDAALRRPAPARIYEKIQG
jgi:hypothetical protein